VSCSSIPKNTKNSCAIFDERYLWYKHAKASYEKWGAPIHLQLAFIKKESDFNWMAKPPRVKLFKVIPFKRPSSSFGYSQAVVGTWEQYKDETNNKISKEKVTHIIVPPIFPGLKKYTVSEKNEKDGTVSYEIKGIEYTEKEIKTKIISAEKYINDCQQIDITKYKSKEESKKLLLLQKSVLSYEKRIVEYKNFLIDKCSFYPRKIIIEAAYDTEGLRNPLKRYSIRDFDFSDEEFKFELKGSVRISEKKENKLTLLASEDEFYFKINGFKEGIEDIRWKDRNYTL